MTPLSILISFIVIVNLSSPGLVAEPCVGMMCPRSRPELEGCLGELHMYPRYRRGRVH